MPPIWKPASIETLRYYVETILDEASDELSDWETKFIEGIQIRLSNNWPLTEAQEKKLESIYAQKTK